ncbi:hypothetical protein [Aurantiacibacter marinus]|uniref:hypothetical protein n=1 Tax=Aurantiacibacter marinus TaxID=874156 RepID=UPI000699823A|nr:hypothetical protein [Aurantiacibacter marinus]
MNQHTSITPAVVSTTATEIQPRHDGWTLPKQAEFLRHLAASHCVSQAASAVGMSRQSAYRLRNRLKGEPFDIAWACAFRRQYDALAEAALERALNGVEVPHFHKGELVHVSRRYDERLTVALLAMQDRLTPIPRARYAEHVMAPADDFEALVERVAEGDEQWSHDCDDDEEDCAEGEG